LICARRFFSSKRKRQFFCSAPRLNASGELGGLAATVKIKNRKALQCKASAEGAPVVRHLIQAGQQFFPADNSQAIRL